MRPIVKMILVSLMVVILSSMVYAQRPNSEIESLRGINGIFVLVEKLQPDIEVDGLREYSIKTDVELKLRLAGIKVFTEEEWFKAPGSPFLYITVNNFKSSSISTYAFSINIELKQDVLLLRSNEPLVNATTWEIANVGIVGETKVATFVRDGVKDEVDIFINDYLSVNPK